MNALGIAAAELPWAVFPCNGDKKPITVHGFKDATQDKALILRQFSNPSAQMIGVPTGSKSGIVVIDIDIKNGARGQEWLDDKIALLPQTRTHKTLSGGLHLLFRAPEGVVIGNSASRIAPGVDVRGNGGYIISPPSPGYAVADDIEMAEMPAWLVLACMKPEPPPPSTAPAAPRTTSDGDLGPYCDKAMDDAAAKVRNAGEGSRNVTLNDEARSLAKMLNWNVFSRTDIESVLTQAAEDAGLDAVEIKKTLKSAIDSGIKVPRKKPEARPMPDRPPEPPEWKEYPPQYARPSDRYDLNNADSGLISGDEEEDDSSPSHDDRGSEDEESSRAEPPPEAEAKKPKAGRKAKPEADKGKANLDADKAKAPETPQKPLPDWAKYLFTDDKGQILSNIANALEALRNAPELKGLVAYDQMMRQLMFTRGIAKSLIKESAHRRPVEDAEVTAVQEWLQRNHLKRITKETVQQALELVGRENAFHPVKEYLNGLVWDGQPRLSRWMMTYLGCFEGETEYITNIGRWFILSIIARTFNPGCKCDYMVILEGEQGLKKSTACSIIGGKWFADNLPEIRGGDDVRVSQHLRGKLLIEIGELSSMRGAAAEALKTFLTRRDERYIAKYGRNEVHEPRQCVFIGTTNQHAYLHDETGARRFWPVKVGAVIDLDGLKRDRDQLFAEAMDAYRKDEPYWPTAEFEKKFIKQEQAARYVRDVWEDVISDYLGKHGIVEITVEDLAKRALSIELRQLYPPEVRRVTNALKRLGWAPARSKSKRWWQRPEVMN
jgi:predicted P-loop ATPase